MWAAFRRIEVEKLFESFVERRRVAVDHIFTQFIDQFLAQFGGFFCPFIHKLFFGGVLTVASQRQHAARDAGRGGDDAVNIGALAVGAGRSRFVEAVFGLEGFAAGFTAVIIKGHGVSLIHVFSIALL